MKKFGVLIGMALVVGSLQADGITDAIALAHRTLDYVQKSRPLPALAEQLRAMEERAPEMKGADSCAALERDIRALRRKILFQHPDLDFETLLITQRGIPYGLEPHMADQYLGRYSMPGPGLQLLRHWKDAPVKEPLLKGAQALPVGTVMNPDLHWEADRLLFAFCDHRDLRTELQKQVQIPPGLCGMDLSNAVARAIMRVCPGHPAFRELAPGEHNYPELSRRFFIYEAAMDGSWVHQLTGTATDPMETRDGRQSVLVEDGDPCYLPDGGIVFTSTRCQGFGRCHNGRYNPAWLLFRMDGDGKHIQPLSFGEANEWEPSVLNDGRIAYTRWDYIDRNAVPWQSLWVMKPDGTGTAHLFGNYTPVPKVESEVRMIPGSRLLLATGAAHHFITAGCPILIDIMKGEDGLQSITKITPEIGYPGCPWEQGGNGYYANPYPVNDTLFFASYSSEAYHHGDKKNAFAPQVWSPAWPSTNAFGICLIDTLGGREVIYRDPAGNTFNPIPVRKTKRPPVIPSALPPRDQAPDYGVCAVDNVYDSRVSLPKGGIRALRFNRIHCQPTAQIPDLPFARGYALYKTPLGVVPVGADGAVAFKMPAEEPIQLQALDKDGMALFTMRSFIYVHRGEQLRCVGCHEQKGLAPVSANARSALAPKAVDITPLPQWKEGVGFFRQIRPILNQHCVKCHGERPGKGPAAGLDFSAADEVKAKAYYHLTSGPKAGVKRAWPYHETGVSETNDYFAAASPLTAMLRKGHHQVKLSSAEWDALIIWMDMNAPYLTSNSWNDPALPAFLRLPGGVHTDYLGTCGLGTLGPGPHCVCGDCWVWEGKFNHQK